MIRTQIQLPDEQARRLKLISRRDGVSISEIVRRSLNETLAKYDGTTVSRYACAAKLLGTLHDQNATDLAENHDKYLADAFSK
ncbi:MAG: ribbon-helix-helix protein, CopG family [Deltaproteobacteria bacterium]|nr:ribbon-helix-helix protein, CopG family [Deltaproteobacteria bacterium]